MAPRPFSQAWGRGAKTELWPLRAVPFGPLPACPTPTYLLVLLQGNTGLSPILGLDKEQLVPLDVFKDALGKDTRQARVCVGSRIKHASILTKLNSAPDSLLSPAET